MILSLGIVLLFINALMLWITDKIVSPFEVRGFWTTVGAACGVRKLGLACKSNVL